MKCDGYAPQDNSQALRKKLPATDANKKFDTGFPIPLLLAGLNPESFDGGPATALFHHFRTLTITDLVLFPSSASFWNRHVLPIGNAIPAVRHAATAVGAAHQAFLLGNLDPLTLQMRKRLDLFATHEYNKAIHHLLLYMSAGGVANIRIIVTCCLLFYCLENVRGCSAEAIRHLKAGSRMLVPLASPATVTTEGGTGSSDAISEICTLFSRLGVEAALYSEDQVVPDLPSHGAHFTNPMEHISQPFCDLAVAGDALWAIDVELSTFNSKAFVLAKPHRGGSPTDRIYDLAQTIGGNSLDPAATQVELPYGPSYESELHSIIKRFRYWRTRFNKTVAEAEKRRVTKRERQQIMMLTLRQRVWETMLEETPQGDPALADSILEHAEQLVQSFSTKHPIFTLESSILSSTSFVCCYSNEERHHRRALKILRSARMCEGVWHSDKLANLIEAGFPKLQLPVPGSAMDSSLDQ